MPLTMTKTPARRQFKDMAGSVNHFLITILIGLDAVRAGTAVRGPTFSTSWEPHDVVRSADRSSEFAVKALMSWIVDALDSYAIALNRKPFVLQDRSDRDSLGAVGRSVGARTDWLAERFGVLGGQPHALTAVAIVWRNRLVHSEADNKVCTSVQNVLLSSADEIADDYQGLDIASLLDDVAKGKPPKFKEATAMVRAVHKFVEHTDGEVLTILNLEDYFCEVLERYVAHNPSRRIANVWGKDVGRRLRCLHQIALESGMRKPVGTAQPVLADRALEQLAQLSPKAARDLLIGPDP
jgi:hypothetical protein